MAKPNEKARAAADEELLRRRKENKHREHSSARKRAYHQAQSSDSHGGATIPGPSTGYYESHPGEKALSDVRVRQRNLVYITGLPLSHAKEEILRGNDYFGQFGHIRKLSVIRRPPGGSVGRQAATAYVTYKRDQDAMEAIAALSDTTIDGHVIRSSFGTTKYCTAYAKQLTCTNPNCMYIHALAPASECYTKDDLGTERFQEESLMEAREQCEKQQRISASRTPIIRSPMMSPQQSPVLGPQQFPPLGSDHRAIPIPLGRPPTAPSSVGPSRAFSKPAQSAPSSEPKRPSQGSGGGGLGARITKPVQIKTNNSQKHKRSISAAALSESAPTTPGVPPTAPHPPPASTNTPPPPGFENHHPAPATTTTKLKGAQTQRRLSAGQSQSEPPSPAGGRTSKAGGGARAKDVPRETEPEPQNVVRPLDMRWNLTKFIRMFEGGLNDLLSLQVEVESLLKLKGQEIPPLIHHRFTSRFTMSSNNSSPSQSVIPNGIIIPDRANAMNGPTVLPSQSSSSDSRIIPPSRGGYNMFPHQSVASTLDSFDEKSRLVAPSQPTAAPSAASANSSSSLYSAPQSASIKSAGGKGAGVTQRAPPGLSASHAPSLPEYIQPPARPQSESGGGGLRPLASRTRPPKSRYDFYGY
eukprot:94636_1